MFLDIKTVFSFLAAKVLWKLEEAPTMTIFSLFQTNHSSSTNPYSQLRKSLGQRILPMYNLDLINFCSSHDQRIPTGATICSWLLQDSCLCRAQIYSFPRMLFLSAFTELLSVATLFWFFLSQFCSSQPFWVKKI